MCFILKTRNGRTPDLSNGSILTALCKCVRIWSVNVAPCSGDPLQPIGALGGNCIDVKQ